MKYIGIYAVHLYPPSVIESEEHCKQIVYDVLEKYLFEMYSPALAGQLMADLEWNLSSLLPDLFLDHYFDMYTGRLYIHVFNSRFEFTIEI